MGSKEGIESLRALPLFSEVEEPDLRRLASHLIERRFPRDSTLIQEGQAGNYMYVLREGRVKVTKLSGAGREKILEILGSGAFFGEMALLDPPERSASVKSLDPVRVLALSRQGFLQALEHSPGLAMAVIRELARRLRHTNLDASHIPYQSVKERTQDLLRRLATDRRRRLARLARAHPPGGGRHGGHLPRDRDPCSQAAEAGRLAATGRQALSDPARGLTGARPARSASRGPCAPRACAEAPGRLNGRPASTT